MERGRTSGVTLAARVWEGRPGASTVVHACWYPGADVVAQEHRLVAHDLRGRG